MRIGEKINCIDFKTDLQRILFNIYINQSKISSSSGDGCCHWQTVICLRFLTVYDFSTSWLLHTTREFYADECDLMANWKWTLCSQTSSKCFPFPPLELYWCFLELHSYQYLAKVHAQQLGNQNVSVYRLEPSPFTAIKRFWTYFCSHRDEYPLGNEHKFEHTLDLRMDQIYDVLNWPKKKTNEISFQCGYLRACLCSN